MTKVVTHHLRQRFHEVDALGKYLEDGVRVLRKYRLLQVVSTSVKVR